LVIHLKLAFKNFKRCWVKFFCDTIYIYVWWNLLKICFNVWTIHLWSIKLEWRRIFFKARESTLSQPVLSLDSIRMSWMTWLEKDLRSVMQTRSLKVLKSPALHPTRWCVSCAEITGGQQTEKLFRHRLQETGPPLCGHLQEKSKLQKEYCSTVLYSSAERQRPLPF